MGENQRKCCKLRFKNTTEQISIELLYTKRDRDVDIRDFFGNILKQINTLQVRFKKDHYELTDSKQEDVLKIVPKVIENFQEFYKGSFGEIASDDEYVDTRTREKESLTMEQKIEEQTTSKMYPAYSSHDSSLGNMELQKEEETQKESKQKQLGSQTADTDENNTSTVSQNADYGGVAQAHKSDIVTTETSQRSGRHEHQEKRDNDSHYVSKSGERYKPQAEKHASNDTKTKKEGEDEEQDQRKESKDHDGSKLLKRQLSSSEISIEMRDAESDANRKWKSVFFDEEKHTDNEDGKQKKNIKTSKDGDVVDNISEGESDEEKNVRKIKGREGAKELEMNLGATGNAIYEDDAEKDQKKEEKKNRNTSKDGDVGKNISVRESDKERNVKKIKGHEGAKEPEMNLGATGNTKSEDDAEEDRKREEKKKMNTSKDGDVGKNSSVGESDEEKPKSKVMTDHKK